MFKISNMDKPVIVISGVKFQDLCWILDFAYLGQAQVPHDHLDDFLKAGELLQIRGIKEGRIHFMTSFQQQTQLVTSNNTTLPTALSTFAEPSSKRPREDDEPSIQEVSEIMKMLLENNPELDVDQIQVKPTTAMTHELPFAPKTPQFTKPPVIQHEMKYISPLPTIMPRTLAIAQALDKEKKKFACCFCKRAMATSARIKKHEKECNDNPNREIMFCSVCHFDIKPTAMTAHLKNKHGQTRKSIPAKTMNNCASTNQLTNFNEIIPIRHSSDSSPSSQHSIQAGIETIVVSPQKSLDDQLSTDQPPIKILEDTKVEHCQI